MKFRDYSHSLALADTDIPWDMYPAVLPSIHRLTPKVNILGRIIYWPLFTGVETAYLGDLTHAFACCDGHVVKQNIVGKWYRCTFCPKDLCADCEAFDTHDSTHAFLVFKAPVDKRAFKAFLYVFFVPI